MTELMDPTEFKRSCCRSFSGMICRIVPLVTIFPSGPFHPNEEPAFQSETYSPPILLVRAGSVNTRQTLETGALISIVFSIRNLGMVLLFPKRIPNFNCYIRIYGPRILLWRWQGFEYHPLKTPIGCN